MVRIAGFAPHVTVITSKQRPRKIVVFGSDGRRYAFLLKGHEDLRQDERAMQLFGLINSLLANNSGTSRKGLAIRRYAVTPLSNNVGIVGWVPNCDTLHVLIKEYRKLNRISLDVERQLMYRMAPMYETLSLMHKVEVFTHALEET